MLKRLKETADNTLRPLAKKVVTPLLSSDVGDEIGSVRVAKRFAKQWAASAGLYDQPADTGSAAAPAADSGLTPAPQPARTASFVGLGEQRPVTLYTTRKHSSCKTARRILDELGVAYEDIDLSDDPDARQKLYQDTEDRTFPQVFIDGKRLGGFDDLVVAREEGRLRTLLFPNA